ncbi:MAG TPA: hypothetical protein VGF55_27895 [Gemmataceae bacterium]|jgi:hypothetical protein
MAQVQQERSAVGRWPSRSWKFWCGLLVGTALGLQLGVVFVDQGWLTPGSRAGTIVLWVLFLVAGCVVGIIGGRRA